MLCGVGQEIERLKEALAQSNTEKAELVKKIKDYAENIAMQAAKNAAEQRAIQVMQNMVRQSA